MQPEITNLCSGRPWHPNPIDLIKRRSCSRRLAWFKHDYIPPTMPTAPSAIPLVPGIQRRDTKPIKQLEHLSQEERLKEPGLLAWSRDREATSSLSEGGLRAGTRRCSLRPAMAREEWAQSDVQEFHQNTRKNFTVRRPSTGRDCAERMWSLTSWRYSRTVWTRSCAICSGTDLHKQRSGTR